MNYTLNHIKEAWQSYKVAKALYVLRDGKWEMQPMSSKRIDGTKAEFRDVRSMVGFPEYLETYKA